MAKRAPCRDCGKHTAARDFVTDEPLCPNCRRNYPLITATRAKDDYDLTEADLKTLRHLERPNPHYKCAAPMRLYLRSQVEEIDQRKYRETPVGG